MWNYEKFVKKMKTGVVHETLQPFCPSCVAGLSFRDVSPADWNLTIVYKDMLIRINLVLVVSVACVKSYPP